MRVIHICPNTVLTLGILLALAFVSLLDSLSALAFLGLGAVLMLRRPQAILDETRRYLWVYAIPLWCLFTTLWSSYPALTLRFGIQLGLTFAVVIAMASRLSPRSFVKLVFVTLALVALASVLMGKVRSDGGWLGVFDSKNAFAAAMSVLMMVALALALDRHLSRLWRLAGLGGVLASGPLLVLAQSAGALITTALAVMAGIVLVWQRHLSSVQKLILSGLSAFAAVLGVILFLTYQEQIFAAMLAQTGKDATLTGRTDLWAAAFGEIARNPLFGQGYQAVWVVGNPLAEKMWAMFGIPSKSGFHFHNTYISNAVEIGIIGVAFQTVSVLVAAWLTLRWAILSPRAESVFLAVFMLRLLLLSTVETLFYFQFNLTTTITLCALIYGLRARAETRPLQADPARFYRRAASPQPAV